MTYEEVEQYYGSGYKISKDGGFSKGTPYNWKKQGFIPIETQRQIERKTQGKLKASLLHCERETLNEFNTD